MARVSSPRCLALLVPLVLSALPVFSQTPADVRPDAGFGAALNVNGATAQIAPNAAYGIAPLTVECWVKLDSARSYNIVIANEAKASATHWEFFTWPNSGVFWVYAPGRKPDHYDS